MKPRPLIDLNAIVEHEGQGLGWAEHPEFLHTDLHLPGGEVGVLRSLGTEPDRTRDRDTELHSQIVGVLELGGVYHGLHEAGCITNVHERHTAVIAPAGNPARNGHPLPHARVGDLGGVRRSVFGHRVSPSSCRECGERPRPRPSLPGSDARDP